MNDALLDNIVAQVLPADAEVRQRALSPTESFICEAPAGSGKTELLTQRILTLLAGVSQPEAILAITFTRKAAAEMRERVLHALAKGYAPEPSSAHQRHTWQLARRALVADQHHQWQLLDNPGRLQIRTFDSLCARLVQALPLQSSLGSQMRISEDAARLYEEAVETFLHSLDGDPVWANPLQSLLAHLDNQAGRLSQLLQAMLHKRDAWMPLLGRTRHQDDLRQHLQQHLQQVSEDHIALLQELMPDIHTDTLKNLAAQAASQLDAMAKASPITACLNLDLSHGLPDASDEGIAVWRGLRSLLLTNEHQWRKRLDVNCGFPPGATAAEKSVAKQQKERMTALLECLALRPGLRDALEDLESLPSTVYDDHQWQTLAVIAELLPIVVAHLHLVFRAKGEVDFIEIAQRARMALGDDEDPTDLALRLDHQIQHILVDEFQDTSASQYHLLRRLTEGWQPDDGRTLFCVGDAMQSIYSFRAAEVGLFLYAKAHGLGHLPLTPLQLTTNFRSDAPVVHWINKVFCRAFPDRNNFATGAVTFAPAEPFKPGRGQVGVELISLNGTDEEAAHVLALVQHYRQADENLSIAILVRSRRQGQAIMAALQPFKPLGVDMASLASQPAVQDLVNLTRAMLDPADTIAWLAILRAPWAAVPLADMLLIRQQPAFLVIEQLENLLQDATAFHQLTAWSQAHLPALAQALRQAWDQRLRKPLRLWLEGLWYQLNGPSCLSDANELASVERFWQCLESLQRDGQLPTPDAVTTALTTLYAAPADDADPLLQIMTIHKSKGLEFDVVILPGLGQSSGRSDSPLLLWQERLSRQGDEQLLMSALSPRHQDTDPIYHHLKQERAKREAYESCRLMYVAATRAKRHLHLLADVKADTKSGQLRSPRKGTSLAAIWPGVEMLWPHPQPSTISSTLTADPLPLAPLQRIPAHWQAPELPMGKLLDDYIAPFEFGLNDPNKLLEPEDNLQRLVGSLLHNILRDMAQQALSRWQQIPPSQRLPIWRAQLLMAGLDKHHVNAGLDRISQAIEKLMADTRLAKLLDQPEYCRPEYPLSLLQPTGVLHLRVDLLWQIPGKSCWLIDYKTASPAPGQPLATFLTQEKQRYHKQMQLYRQALQHMGHQDLRMGLYFTEIAEWVEYAE